MKIKTYDSHKSSISSLNANIVAAGSLLFIEATLYLIPIIPLQPLVLSLCVFFFEKRSDLVRFTITQYFLIYLIQYLFIGVDIILFALPFSQLLIGLWIIVIQVVSIAMLAFTCFIAVNAYLYKAFYVPGIGVFAELIINKRKGVS